MRNRKSMYIFMGEKPVRLNDDYDLSTTLDFIKASGKGFPKIMITKNKKRVIV